MVHVTFPLFSKDAIKEATALIRAHIQSHKSELAILQALMKQVQTYCKHEGQETGSNERDGSWANPCPTCGESR